MYSMKLYSLNDPFINYGFILFSHRLISEWPNGPNGSLWAIVLQQKEKTASFEKRDARAWRSWDHRRSMCRWCAWIYGTPWRGISLFPQHGSSPGWDGAIPRNFTPNVRVARTSCLADPSLARSTCPRFRRP